MILVPMEKPWFSLGVDLRAVSRRAGGSSSGG
jgi:hypothetical protein